MKAQFSRASRERMAALKKHSNKPTLTALVKAAASSPEVLTRNEANQLGLEVGPSSAAERKPIFTTRTERAIYTALGF